MFNNAFQGYAYSYPHKTAYRSIDPAISLTDAWKNESTDSLFLYLHIPFCEFRCGFCNLFTHVQPELELTKNYLRSIELQAQQIRAALPDAKFARLAIGGGTPTHLNLGELQSVFATLRDTMGADLQAIPISCEASPATIDSEKLDFLRAQGVDRLSLGVQSFRKQETGSMGRPQNPEQVQKSIELIKSAGFPIMNLDLIYGAKDQTTESWLQSVDMAIHHQAEEIYLYPLYVRELTGLKRTQQKLSEMDQMGWDAQRLDAYRAARDYLVASGYEQVSFRMFRRSIGDKVEGPVYCCQSDGMIGLGCGARSYTRDLHYSYEYAVNSKAVLGIIHNFLKKEAEDFNQIQFGYLLDEDDQKRRFVMMGLLQVDGLDHHAYQGRFNTPVIDDFPQLGELYQFGYMNLEAKRLRLTEAGIEMSDAIGPWLYSAKVNELMETYECR